MMIKAFDDERARENVVVEEKGSISKKTKIDAYAADHQHWSGMPLRGEAVVVVIFMFYTCCLTKASLQLFVSCN
jgi:hypothetical protein